MKYLKLLLLMLLTVGPAAAQRLSPEQIDSLQKALYAPSPYCVEPTDECRALLLRGDSLMADHNTQEALRLYQQAFELQDCVDTRTRLADACYQRGDYEQCISLLQQLDRGPFTHKAYRELFYSFRNIGNIDSQIYWGSELVEHHPYDGEIVARLALCYAQNEQPQNGVAITEAYRQRDSTNLMVNRAYADCLFIDRQFDRAISQYEQLLAVGDSTYNVLYSIGMCYSQIDSLQLARTFLYKAAVKNNFQNYGCLYRLGIVCVDLGEYFDGSIYLWGALQKMQPDPTMQKVITRGLGQAYYQMGDYQKAIDQWQVTLSCDPTALATCYNIAVSYGLLGQQEQALHYYRHFLELAQQEESPNSQLQEMISQATRIVNAEQQR